MALPVALAPIELSGMGARRGEVQAARAAEAAGVPFCLSTVSACSIAEVARGVTKPFWFQLYMIRDRGFMRELLHQARDAGCDALVFTVEMPVPGSRSRLPIGTGVGAGVYGVGSARFPGDAAFARGLGLRSSRGREIAEVTPSPRTLRLRSGEP